VTIEITNYNFYFLIFEIYWVCKFYCENFCRWFLCGLLRGSLNFLLQISYPHISYVVFSIANFIPLTFGWILSLVCLLNAYNVTCVFLAYVLEDAAFSVWISFDIYWSRLWAGPKKDSFGFFGVVEVWQFKLRLFEDWDLSGDSKVN